MSEERGCWSVFYAAPGCLLPYGMIGGFLLGGLVGPVVGGVGYSWAGVLLGFPAGAALGWLTALTLVLGYAFVAESLRTAREDGLGALAVRWVPSHAGEWVALALFLPGAAAGGYYGYRGWGAPGAVAGVPFGGFGFITVLVVLGVVLVSTAGKVYRAWKRPPAAGGEQPGSPTPSGE